jgi:hypothetical protein
LTLPKKTSLPGLERSQSIDSERRKAILCSEDILRVLSDSTWAPALHIEGLDVLDAIRVPVYLILLKIERETRKAGENTRMDSMPFSLIKRLRSRGNSLFQDLRSRSMPANPKEEPVVFWPCEPTHVQAQVPVASALGHLGIDSIFFASRPAILEQLRSRGIQAIYSRGAWPEKLSKARREGRRMARLLSADPGIRPLFANISCEPDRLSSILRKRIGELLPHVHEVVACLNAIKNEISPGVLVVGNDVTHEGRTACLWSKNRGLQTVCLMHGLIVGDPLHTYHIADRFLAYGQSSMRYLEALGIDSSKVLVCGVPYLDDRPLQTGRIHPDIRKRLGLGDGQPWVLMATSGPGNSISHNHHRKIIENVIRLSSKLNDLHFVSKLHRKDRLEYYKSLSRVVPGSKLTVIPYGDPHMPESIFDWLQGCTVVLTGASSVAVEAMMMDVPVITMDFADELSRTDFIQQSAVIHAVSLDELEKSLLSIIYSPESHSEVGRRAKAYLEETFYALDGKSAHRCAQSIQSLVESKDLCRP